MSESNSRHQVLHPSIPYADDIPGGLFPGKSVLIRGTVRQSENKRFNIDFCCGRLINGDHRDDVSLHFNARFHTKSSWFTKSENTIVINTLQNNKWAMEYRVKNTLEVGEPFTLRVLVLRDYYKITLNGKHLADFIHRMPVDRVRCIYIDGCISIEQIEYQGTPQPQTPTETNEEQKNDFVAVNVFKPTIPFVHSIGKSGFVPPRQLKVTGCPRMSATRFEVNLLADTEYLLHFRVDLPTSTTSKGFVVRNSTINGQWQQEERDIPNFPFKLGHTFDLILSARNDHVDIQIDNLPFALFRRRDIPFEKATTIIVKGDLIAQSIRYS